ncbi:glycosyltransferase family 25 (LPS biosynthesis protein) domain-containing protein [Phthorimaea operculella]|nr:glycosyltransferase family 25 (LPS biosynthesis protein) domain-containing protein [Phthorimaea operculella]
MYIWIYTDYNEDESSDVIKYWVDVNKEYYHDVIVNYDDTEEPRYKGETSPSQWTQDRFNNVMDLREQALNVAREKWADFHFMLDADVYLTNPKILKHLVVKDYAVVAPMLQSDGMYSNFWAAMSERRYYKKSEEYKEIVEREKVGCFNVPMVHSAVLINMNHPKSDGFSYDGFKFPEQRGPMDDIVIFALSVMTQDVNMMLCNEEHAGYVQVPLVAGEDLEKDVEHLINVKLLALSEEHEIPLNEYLKPLVKYPQPSKFGLDEIYMINLERRDERRAYMQKCFTELGLSVQHFEAIDGRTLMLHDLPHNIHVMPGYEDPFHKRPMKTGEIGCFLSHYLIWEDMIKKDHWMVMILEDDVYFRPHFRNNLQRLLEEVKDGDWDLLYIGRKILTENDEMRVSPLTVVPSYSYWTIGYILTNAGARKLIDAKPLEKLLPVDEFLPIMFDKHPNDTWKSFFPIRNLKALSASPLLIEPVRYVNQPGYVSDTEASPILTVDEPPILTVDEPPVTDAATEEEIDEEETAAGKATFYRTTDDLPKFDIPPYEESQSEDSNGNENRYKFEL